jgi:hypothetical protein
MWDTSIGHSPIFAPPSIYIARFCAARYGASRYKGVIAPEPNSMRGIFASLKGPALLGLAALGVATGWIYLLFFVIGPLSR